MRGRLVHIAKWTGVPLSHILNEAGAQPQAKFVVYHSMDGWVDAIDMDDALHGQTLVSYGINGGDLPVGHGGPLRLRLPKQLPGHLTRERILHDLAEAEKHCSSCAEDLREIGEEASERYEYIPAQVIVIEDVSIR